MACNITPSIMLHLRRNGQSSRPVLRGLYGNKRNTIPNAVAHGEYSKTPQRLKSSKMGSPWTTYDLTILILAQEPIPASKGIERQSEEAVNHNDHN